MTNRADLLAARHLPVMACVNRLAIGPLLARVEDDLLDVARRCARQPETRVVGIVGDEDRLVGVLPILRIVEDVIARVDPEALMAGIIDIEDVARFSHAVEARTAGDAMLPPASVRAEATVSEAFRLMQQRHLSGIYVVEAGERVVGYLDLLELAVLYVDVLAPAAGAGGTDATEPSPARAPDMGD